MSYTVLVTDFAWASLDLEREVLDEIGAELLVAADDDATLGGQIQQADAVLTNWRQVPAEPLVDSKCVVISRYGVGVDNIPVIDATRLGIVVANVPDFCLDEVSDHALALLLASARNVVGFARATRSGAWDLAAGAAMPRLRGQTLGLVGYGNTARALAPKAQGLGLHVLAYTPRTTSGMDGGVELTNDLGEVLARADYLSLHAPATEATRNLIGEPELRAMKRTAYLINTSRGALVNEDALHGALIEDRIAGAALDVLQSEPPAPAHPLLELDNVIVTPHAAFFSTTSIPELQVKAARNVVRALTGEAPDAVVNPDVLTNPDARFMKLPTKQLNRQQEV